ncbi:MAG: ketoacyl-ACP synthase III [Planctomycetia bacterium]|nr:ketoacyl-ACP synthase III [Planctomycetia bacterium]
MTTNQRIRGMATALPRTVLTNCELQKRFQDSQIGGFLQVTGIDERRCVASGETASDLAVQAAESLFHATGADRSQIDALLFCSLTPDYKTPPTACLLQHRLGLSQNTCTFDLVQACPAFTHSLATSTSLLTCGVAKNVLLIHADSLTQFIHPLDRELVPIHGDGAIALWLQGDANGTVFDWFAFGTNGQQADRIIIPDGMGRHPVTSASLQEEKDEKGNVRTRTHLKMDGAAVFHFVIHTIPSFLRNACAEHNCTLDDYDLILFHQANKMIVDMLYNILKIPREKRFMYLEKVGNLSGASLPFVLAQACREKKLSAGSRVLMCGFGAGLSWGAVSLRWQEELPVVPDHVFL